MTTSQQTYETKQACGLNCTPLPVSQKKTIWVKRKNATITLRLIRKLCKYKDKRQWKQRTPPIAGVRVKLIEENREKRSDRKGLVTFNALKSCAYTLKIESKTYQSQTLSIDAKVFSSIKNIEVKPKWDVSLIPAIQRANNWNKGAELLEEWFSRSRYTYPDPKKTNTGKLPYNDTIISLQWALSFKRVKDQYDDAWNKKLYVTTNVKRDMEKDLTRLGAFKKKRTPFHYGDLSKTTNEINAGDFYVQNITVKTSGTFTSTDDMVAALANFNFRFAVEGTVTFKATRKIKGIKKNIFTVTINKAGLYIKDSFDFIDKPGYWISQPLGCWNPVKNTMSKTNLNLSSDEYCVNNESFRDWSNTHRCGGDFIVFSDIHKRSVNESWEVIVNA